jgi:hypothetical protein
VPALIACVLYALLVYAIGPMIRAYREKYNQYLPLGGFTERTTSFRERTLDRLAGFFLPRRHQVVSAAGHSRTDSATGEELTFEDEDGDRMFGFDVNNGGQSGAGTNTSNGRRAASP